MNTVTPRKRSAPKARKPRTAPQREGVVQAEVRDYLVDHVPAYRANVGQAWTGDCLRLENGDMLIKNPRPFKTGLPVGFSDVFGFKTVHITQQHVGMRMAQFYALELKSKTGKATGPQLAFLGAVQNAGGLAGIVRSVEDARQILGLIK
jgi:hypothetical protein